MYLQEIGEIVHLARSGRLIVRLTDELAEGEVLYDQKNNEVARVAELIGPVSAPFASAIPFENSKARTGGKMYVSTSTAGTKRRIHR